MTAYDVSSVEAIAQSDRRRTLLARSAIAAIFGPALIYALYLILLAPAQYQTTAAFAVRGAEPAPVDALGAIGIVAPTSASTDAHIVEDYIRSPAMVAALRERFGFEEAYSRFSLDPLSYLPQDATPERATSFWQGRVRLRYDLDSAATTVEVSAYRPEDALRLTQGVLVLSEELVNRMSDRAVADLEAAAAREIERKRQEYEQSKDRLAAYQGRHAGIDVTTPSQQAIELVGSLDAELAQKRIALAAASQTFQADAPQMAGMRREIAALEAERARAVSRAMTAPGESATGSQIEAQAILIDYEFAQQAYQAAITAGESARRQDITDRKYVVAFVPPQLPEVSNWWSRLGNVLAVLIGSALLWAIGALVYSIIRDHME